MIKKNSILVLIFLSFVLFVASINSASAFFYWSHEKWVIQGFDEVDSPTTQMCRPYLSVTINGDLASDSGVVYYGDSNDLNRKSYIYPHTLGGYKTCLADAGSDASLKCFCYGNYLHIIQDSYSHNIGGITEVTLKKFLGNNYFGHMTVEQNFADLHQNIISNSNQNLYSKVNAFDKTVLNDLMVTDSEGKMTPGGKYMTLLNDMGGIKMDSSVDTIRRGYLGVGFYDTVYKDKVSLPLYPYIIIPALMVLVSLAVISLMLIFGRTSWRWITVIIWLILLIAGIFVFISFYNGNSWQIITAIIQIPPKFGYLGVTDSQVNQYDQIIQKATNDFLRDPLIAEGSLAVQDASGLSYKDKSGNWIDGSLSKAETGYKFFLLPSLIIIALLFNLGLMFKSLGIKMKSKFLNGSMNFLVWIGLIIVTVAFVMISYGLLS